MAELQKAAQKNKFGYMFSIARSEFIRQVTEASQEIPVVVFLYKDRYPFDGWLTESFTTPLLNVKYWRKCWIVWVNVNQW